MFIKFGGPLFAFFIIIITNGRNLGDKNNNKLWPQISTCKIKPQFAK